MNLIINSSPKDLSRSVSGTLAEQLAEKLGGPTETIRLYEGGQKYFNFEFREDWIADMIRCERIVIPVPMWNFAIPAALKDFLDKISKEGKLWKIGPGGRLNGLLPDRPVYIIMTSGGYYPSGAPDDFVVPYLKTYFAFIGITDVRDFRLGGVYDSEERVKDRAFIETAAQDMFKIFGL